MPVFPVHHQLPELAQLVSYLSSKSGFPCLTDVELLLISLKSHNFLPILTVSLEPSYKYEHTLDLATNEIYSKILKSEIHFLISSYTLP